MAITRNQEQVTAWGWAKQADIATANVVGDLKAFTRTNGQFSKPTLNTENDADEYGKGHEFGTATYKTSWDAGGTIEAYCSSEVATWAFCYALGKVVEAPANTYTITPLAPVTDGLELPYFSYLGALRQGAGVVEDFMAVGCQVEDVLIRVGYGPGRSNSTITINWVGSGKLTEPSGLAIPAATAVHLLPSASLTLTMIGMDYVALKRIVSIEFGWKNNILMDFGFYPGSGFQTPGDATTGAIRGRMLVGRRQPILRYTVLVENGSTEYAKLKAMTSGTAVIGLTNSATENFTATYQQVKIVRFEPSEVEGFYAATCECLPEYHNVNGVLSVVTETALAGCAQ